MPILPDPTGAHHVEAGEVAAMGTAPATVSVGNPEGHERSCYPDELSCPDVSDPTHSVATMNQTAGSSVITQPLPFDDPEPGLGGTP